MHSWIECRPERFMHIVFIICSYFFPLDDSCNNYGIDNPMYRISVLLLIFKGPWVERHSISWHGLICSFISVILLLFQSEKLQSIKLTPKNRNTTKYCSAGGEIIMLLHNVIDNVHEFFRISRNGSELLNLKNNKRIIVYFLNFLLHWLSHKTISHYPREEYLIFICFSIWCWFLLTYDIQYPTDILLP